ncbi:hypothetical protein APHAL10511_004244 [Amanita phalloides]|nr:hypothetical protein APHAL10511_004244 [Amanita phalloides]
MMKWLDDDIDKQSDKKLWGVQKNVYRFPDLKLWLDNHGKGLEIMTSSPEEVVEEKRHKGKGKKKQVETEESSSEEMQIQGKKVKGKAKNKRKDHSKRASKHGKSSKV